MHLRLVPDSPPAAPPTNAPWMRRVLTAAAAYGAAWGGLAVLAPTTLAGWMGGAAPADPWLLRWVGAMVAAYAVGFALAARDPLAHWRITLVGLFAKVIAPAGVVAGAVRGEVPWRPGVLAVVADVIWWVPLALILAAAWRAHRTLPSVSGAERVPSRKRA